MTHVIKPEEMTEYQARMILSAPPEKRGEVIQQLAKETGEKFTRVKLPSARRIQAIRERVVATPEDHLRQLAQDLVRWLPVNRLVELTQNLLLHAEPPCDGCPASSICETLADNLQLISHKMEDCKGWKKR